MDGKVWWPWVRGLLMFPLSQDSAGGREVPSPLGFPNSPCTPTESRCSHINPSVGSPISGVVGTRFELCSVVNGMVRGRLGGSVG